MISRRNLLRTGARASIIAATTGGAVLAGADMPALAEDRSEALAEIHRLIEVHRRAEAEFEAYVKRENEIIACSGCDAYSVGEKQHIDLTFDALADLMWQPVTTFEEIMAKVRYFRTIKHFLDSLSCFEDQDGAFFDAFPEGPEYEEASSEEDEDEGASS